MHLVNSWVEQKKPHPPELVTVLRIIKSAHDEG